MAKDWERKLKRELKNDALKEFEGWTNGDFIAHILGLRELVDALEKASSENKMKSSENGEKQDVTESMFKQDWSYPTKIHFLLQLHQKPLTSEDLDRYLLKLDTHYKDYNNPKKNLSVHLGRATKSGRIKKIKEPGIKLKYFVLPEWVDKEGVLVGEYKRTIHKFN